MEHELAGFARTEWVTCLRIRESNFLFVMKRISYPICKVIRVSFLFFLAALKVLENATGLLSFYVSFHISCIF